jgi:uncharacterized delta-60 repeat protein
MRGLRRGFGLLAGASILLLLVPAMARAAGPGDLDGTFSNDGMQTVDVGTGDHSEQILVSGGKILVLGEGSSDLTLVGLTSAGDPDPTFGGGDGIVKMNLLGVEEPFGGLGLLPGGKIMTAVSTSNGGYDRLGLARFTPAGAPDPTFGGGDGKRTVDFGKNFYAFDMAVLPDGKFLVGGAFDNTPDSSEFLVTRLRSNGTLDPTFGGGDGFVLTHFRSGQDGAYRLGIDPHGRIVAAGWTEEPETPLEYDVAAARYLANGAPDHGFSGDGKVVTQFFEGFDDWAYGLGFQGDKVVLGLHLNDSGEAQIGLLRYRSNGTLDPTFGGGDGEVITPRSGPAVSLRDLAIDANNRIVAVAESGTPQQMLIARYAPGGTLQTGFGTNGFATTTFGTPTSVEAVAIGPNNTIVVTGETGGNVALARFLG